MSTPRVTPWSDDAFPETPADLVAGMKARRAHGELIGIDRLLLRSTPLATGWNGLLGRVRAEFRLPLELRELIMLRVAALNGAEFEWGVHHPAYLEAGGTDDKAAALRLLEVPDTLFDERERILLRLTDQSTHRVEVDAEIIEQLVESFDEEQTVEAVATVAAYNMVSRFLVALDI